MRTRTILHIQNHPVNGIARRKIYYYYNYYCYRRAGLPSPLCRHAACKTWFLCGSTCVPRAGTDSPPRELREPKTFSRRNPITKTARYSIVSGAGLSVNGSHSRPRIKRVPKPTSKMYYLGVFLSSSRGIRFSPRVLFFCNYYYRTLTIKITRRAERIMSYT